MSSVVILQAKGLETSPNELTVSEGSMIVADNVVIKRDGVVESRRGFKLFGSEFGSDSSRLKQILSYKDLILRHYSDTLQFQVTEDGELFSSFSGSYSEVESGLRIKGTESNGNYYFTTSAGIQKISAKTAGGLSTAADFITPAGGIKALDTEAYLDVTLGDISGFLPADSAVAYRIVWGIKDANSNLVLGTPSQRAEIYNPRSALTAQDLNNLLLPLDNVGDVSTGLFTDGATGWPASGYLPTYGVPYTADGSQLATQVIALAQGIDQSILYANDSATGCPLNIASAAIAGTVCTVTFSAGTPSTYLSTGDKIFLTGFDCVADADDLILNAVQTVVTAGATTITFNTTATGVVTTGASSKIESGTYRNIAETGADGYSALVGLDIDIPATAQQLATIQVTIERFMDALQDEPVTNISAGAVSFLTGLAITTTANVELQFTIPDDVTTSHFYQIYRSAIAEATGVTVLTDLTPSDDLQLVYEAFPTTAELTAQRVSVVDVTPDQFRGANLYTNASSGGNILQANDIPPAAKDINRFKNYTFFANTRTRHKMALNLLGVQQLINLYGTGVIPVLTIGTDSQSTSFSFITGVQEVTDITCVAAGSITAGQYFTINSANNLRAYYVWYRKDGAGTDPAVADRLPIVVDILTGDADTVVAAKTRDTLNAITVDFSVVDNTLPTIRVTNIDEGPAVNAAIGTTTFTITVITPGTGEEVSSNSVLMSQLASVARAVDATARSLVRIINQSDSSVYAYYLSGATDVPGKIFLESRVLTGTDDPFYLLVNSASIGESFNPVLSPDESVDAGVSIIADTPIVGDTSFVVTGHGLLAGDQFLLSGSKNASPTLAIDGIYTVKAVASANQFSVELTIGASATVTAGSIGLTYLPDTEVSNNEVKPNRIYYSKLQQPEAVPIGNTIDVGDEDKQILRIIPLRDSLFVFKEDGLYRVSGETAPFTLALYDASCVLVAPDSIGILNNVVYGWTRKGIETVTESGTSVITRPIDVDILPKASSIYPAFRTATWGVGYESENTYTVYTTAKTTDTTGTIGYSYNNLTETWVNVVKDTTCGRVGPDDKLYLGPADANQIEQERKSFDRTDYADREYEKEVSSTSFTNNGLSIEFADVSEIEPGDVLVQEQLLSVYEFNAMLRKLDNDPGVGDADYFETLEAEQGDNLRSKVAALALKLDADPGTAYTDYADRITAGAGPYSTTINTTSVANPTVLTTAADHSLYSITNPAEGRVIEIAGITSNANVSGEYEITRTGATTFTVPVNVISVTDGTGSFQRLEQGFLDIKACYNIIVDRLNTDTGVTFRNYTRCNTTTPLEVVVLSVNRTTKRVTVNQALDFVVGPITQYKHIPTSFTYGPHTMGDPLGFKQVREATVMFENKAFTRATVSFATDLMPEFIPVTFTADSNGIFGMGGFFGSGYFGGASNNAPFRTYIPGPCQRCRYMIVNYVHEVAREKWAIQGMTMTAEVSQSTRAYR